MARKLPFVPVLSFLISGCALTTDTELQTALEQPASSAVAEKPTGLSENFPDGESGNEAIKPLANKTLSQEEIRLIQMRLKENGFDPGPIDGVMGSRTRAALLRLESGCTMLGDLLAPSDVETSQQTSGTQAIRNTAAVDKISSKEEVQLVQVRLKDAGFDPGPIDGKLGSKTKVALFRFQSGCALIKNFPATSDMKFQTAATETLRAVHSKNQAVASRATSPGNNARSKDEVQLIQVRLKDAGLDPGPIDGIMGPKTRLALQQYRTSRGFRNSAAPSLGNDLMLEQ